MDFDDFRGLATRAPLIAFSMAVFMISLMGIPPTIGFYAKYYVIVALIDHDLLWLAVAIVVMSAISAFFYLKVVVVMYFSSPEEATKPEREFSTPLLNLGIYGMVVGVFLLGLFSSSIINLADKWESAVTMVVAVTP
jgi:NADH-quinone oxidoreductase subunit N